MVQTRKEAATLAKIEKTFIQKIIKGDVFNKVVDFDMSKVQTSIETLQEMRRHLVGIN